MTQPLQASGVPRPAPQDKPAAQDTFVTRGSEPPLKEVLVELWQNIERLLRQELTLASAELELKARKLKAEAAASAFGGGLVLAGVLAFVAALILLLALVMPAWLAALLTSGATLGAGVMVLKKVRPAISDVTPERTLQNIKKDLQTFTEATK